MKNIKVGILLVCTLMLLTACSGTLSTKNVEIESYEGIEVGVEHTEDTTEEDIDKVVARMMTGYVAEHDLPEDTQVTDAIVKATLSDSSETVEQYRNELRKKIETTKEKTSRSTLENKVWEEVMDRSEVKRYPKERLAEVEAHLVKQYEGYAKEAQMEYDAYMEMSGLTKTDLGEAAKASVKQELVAEAIANKYGLKPNEEEFQKALEEYATQYKFSTVDLLLKSVSEDEMRILVMQDNVKAWLTDRCKIMNDNEE